ncbi:MAG TPA: EAL domain-containing protein [Alphaproteobacteria bacterium]
MIGLRDRRRERPTFLERYASQLGELVERQHAEAALIAARNNAERSAGDARRAQIETERANLALREEMDRRLKALADLEYLANHDPLTDLPNRNLFNLRLKQVLDRARRTGEAVGLMFLDLDRFKDVNDTLGHDVGDDLLREVARRLKISVRAEDTVARVGGDEFAVIQVGLNYPAEANIQVVRILRYLTEPVHIGSHKLFTSASVGITVFPRDTQSPEQLQKNADLAMYLAKEDQRSTFRFYDSTLDAVAKRRAFLEQELRAAIEQEQLTVYYQPKVSIRSGDPVGAEALVRWLHPEQGMVSPAEFIPVAERTGLIVPIGELTLRRACTQFQKWHRDGYGQIKLAVNLSASQFSITDIPKLVREVLEETGFSPDKLELEVTETAVMNDMHNAVDVLNDLHSIGVSLSIDDFGTGYSSLSYLRQLPVNRIKIDRSFIAEIDRADAAAAIARAVVNLGRSLGLEVVAEGVETVAQLEYLRSIDCDEAQGFLFSKAVPAAEFEQYLAERVKPRRR